MNNLTKLIILFIAFSMTAFTATAQRLEIMIVGSSHDNPKGSEDFAQVIGKLKRFKPDQVFGEYVPAAQLVQLDSTNWARRAFARSKKFMERQFPAPASDLEKSIAKARRSLAKSPGQHRLRMDLASWYARKNDRANLEYQMHLVEQHRPAFSAADLAYYTQRFKHPDTVTALRLYRPASEYTTIFFPLMEQLGLNGMHSMDCQKFDKAWSKAWSETDKLIGELSKQARADSSSQAAATLRAIDTICSFTADDKKKMTRSPYVNMNTDRYAELNDAWNFYGGKQAFHLPGFPVERATEMFAQWTNRNEGMCANLLEQARAAGARRVVVAVGAAHRKIMADILARQPDVKVIGYNEFQ